MPANTGSPVLKERQKAMKDGKEHLFTICSGCQGKV